MSSLQSQDLSTDEETTINKEVDEDYKGSSEIKVKATYNTKPIQEVALASIRYGVEDRATAAIATATLTDYGIVSQTDLSQVIDKSKVGCLKCGEVKNYSSSTTNMSTHLKSKHGIRWLEVRLYLLQVRKTVCLMLGHLVVG